MIHGAKPERASLSSPFLLPPASAYHPAGKPGLLTKVKGKIGGAYNNQIIKDFATITTFIAKYNYLAGIFILYKTFFSVCQYILNYLL